MGLVRRLALFTLILLSIFCFFALWQYYDYKKRPLVIKEDVTFKIVPGAHVRKVLQALSQSPDIKPFSRLWFEVFVRLEGKSTKIQAGEYKLEKNITGAELIDKTIKGEVLQHALTLVDGWTFKEILNAIQSHPAIQVTLHEKTEEAYIQALNLPYKNLEGLFFPETYFFPSETTDKAFLLRAYHMMQHQLEIAWQARASDIPIQTPYEALIVASILEKESGLPSEWPIISQVFYNRMNQKMRLQTDPTVLYGLRGEFTGPLKKEDLKKPTPYNTYLIAGLPPTPISNPSFGAILAACHPMSGDYLYFVAKGDGSHEFSKTLEEHQKWVDWYLKGTRNGKK